MKQKWCIKCRRDKERGEHGWLTTRFGSLCPDCKTKVENGFTMLKQKASRHNVKMEIRCSAHFDALASLMGKDGEFPMTDEDIKECEHGRSKSELLILFRDACNFEERELKNAG